MIEDTSKIQTAADFREFLDRLVADFKETGKNWTNQSLGDYLEAMAAWSKDADGWCSTQEQKHPFEQCAEILLGARVYE